MKYLNNETDVQAINRCIASLQIINTKLLASHNIDIFLNYEDNLLYEDFYDDDIIDITSFLISRIHYISITGANKFSRLIVRKNIFYEDKDITYESDIDEDYYEKRSRCFRDTKYDKISCKYWKKVPQLIKEIYLLTNKNYYDNLERAIFIFKKNDFGFNNFLSRMTSNKFNCLKSKKTDQLIHIPTLNKKSKLCIFLIYYKEYKDYAHSKIPEICGKKLSNYKDQKTHIDKYNCIYKSTKIYYRRN